MFPDFTSIMAVTIAGLTLAASPGPSMMYVVSISMSQGRMAGFASSVGLALGGMIHAIIASIGLGALIVKMPVVFQGIQILGAFYLFYLGVKTILEKSITSEDLVVENIDKKSLNLIFKQGVIVELLNPKTILFFLAFLPQFINSDTEHLKLHMFILGIIVPLTAIPFDVIATVSGRYLADKIAGSKNMQNTIKYISGAILIILALITILSVA